MSETGGAGRRPATARLDARRGMADGERGAALVEFAIVAIVLAVVVFGTIDIGRAYATWNQVKNAAREGAAFAERNPLSQRAGTGCVDPNTIEYRAQTEGGSRNTNLAVSVSPAVSGGCQTPSATQTIVPGAEVTVTVSRSFTMLTPIISALVGTPTISASQSVTVQG